MSTQSILIQRFASGEEKAFKELYFVFYPHLMRYGKSLGMDHSIVQDAVQDLFIWLWEHPLRLVQSKAADQYLYRALRNNLVTLQKKVRRQNELLNLEVGVNAPDAVLNDALSQKEGKELDHKLSEIMDRLPRKQKEVIFLRYFEDRSFDEISDLMGVSSQVARNYATRALKKLRKHSVQIEKILYLTMILSSSFVLI